MKIFFILLLLSLCGFSQQLKYGIGGRAYDINNSRITPDSVRQLLKANDEALKLYNAGRRKKTLGNVLFYGGLGLGVYNVVYAVLRDPSTQNSSGKIESTHTYPTAEIIGGVMVLGSIPIKLGSTKKIKAAINEHNQRLVDIKKLHYDLNLLANSNGIGLHFTC